MKKLLALAMALTLCLGLAACGGDTTDASTDDTAQTGETVTLKVGATPAPHQEILEQVVDNLAEQGITLEIVPTPTTTPPTPPWRKGRTTPTTSSTSPTWRTSTLSRAPTW